MITRPFNFSGHIRETRTGFDLVPFLDVVVIVAFFGLFFSRFILAPGVAIDLNLPASQGTAVDALPTSRVLTVGEVDGRDMLIFEGRILNLAKFDRFLADRRGRYDREVLLVRADRDVSMVLLVRVMEMARAAGFGQVLLAAEPEPGPAAGQPEGPRP